VFKSGSKSILVLVFILLTSLSCISKVRNAQLLSMNSRSVVLALSLDNGSSYRKKVGSEW
jgi:hypothetical protein